MATRWADSFEDNAAANLGADYNVTGTWTIVTGRRSGTSAANNSSSTTTLSRTIGGTEATLLQSIAFKPATLSGTSTRSHMRFLEGSTVHVSIVVTNAGALAVYRGDVTTLLGTTASAPFTVGNWYWFQVKVVIHDTTGSVEIRDANGTVLINLTSIDTKNGGTGYCDVVSIGTSGVNGNSGDYDDWHVWDSTGTICNTFTNDTRIDHKLPDGAGDVTQFTPSAGSNFQCVDEANWNTTDYVDSATAGQQDLYTFGDISHNPPNIFAVLRTAVAQKDDAGARSLKLLTKRGGTVYAGSAIGLTQGSFVRLVDVQEADPSTSAAWTQTNLNAAQFGEECV